jgi:hypothetical protein
MEQSDLLRHAVAAFEGLRVPYFVTGSTAAIAYGEPRFTNDIDIVVDMQPEQVDAVCARFPAPDFYVSRDAAREAVRRRGQFNVIHPASGLKIDVIVRKQTPHDDSRFARVVRLRPAADYVAAFAAPEDVILKKLEYYAAGGSEKHLRDIAGILMISGDTLDREYLAAWAVRLELASLWRQVVDAHGKRR